MVVPVYNAEVSPKDIRGRLVSLQQLSITAGIMVYFHHAATFLDAITLFPIMPLSPVC